MAGGYGREAELGAVIAALSEGEPVVVTGPPGIGKTWLLRAVAERLGGEGVRVDLAGADDPAEVVARVAVALGLGAAPEPPIRAALEARRALLVLDEAEGAAGFLGAWVRAWASPPVRVLVGSRARVEGLAHVRVLGPLAVRAARALYLERARALVPELALADAAVDALIEAVDALPLAIELAAARVRLYPPEALHRRLPDALVDPRGTGRHGSLHAAIDTSWALLGAPEREALARASVFRGPFDAAAFEAVTGADASVLERLLDASLAHLDTPGRARLLRTVRTFAAARLAPEDRSLVAGRHAAHVVTAVLAARAAARRGEGWREVVAWRDDLAEAGRSDPRAALLGVEVALEVGPIADPGPAPQGVPAARWAVVRAAMLGRLGRHAEALEALDAVAPEDAADRLALPVARLLQWLHRSPARARDLVPEVEAALPGAEPRAAAEAAIASALALAMTGDEAAARAVLERGRRVIGPVGDHEVEARLLAYLGLLSRPRAVAGDHLRRAAALQASQGDDRREATTLSWWGVDAHERGALAEAREALERSVRLLERCGDALLEAEVRGHLVDLALDERRLDDAAGALALLRRAPVAPPALVARTRGREGLLALLRGERAAAVAAFEEATADLAAAGKPGLAACHDVYLAVALADDPARAEALLERAAAVAGEVRSGVPELVRLAREGRSGPPTRAALAAVERHPTFAARLVASLLGGYPRVAADGSWFEARAGVREDLSGKPVLRRLLATLAAAGPGVAVGRSALVAGGWPGERMRADSADGRLHAAVRTLRKLGLADALSTTELGGALAYALSPEVTVA